MIWNGNIAVILARCPSRLRGGRKHSFSCTIMYGRQPVAEEDDDDENWETKDESFDLLVLLEQVVEAIVTRPTPGIIPPLPVGYPIALTVVALVTPSWTTSVLLVTFFVLYSFIGREWILNDYFDEKQQEQQQEQANETKHYETDSDEEDPAPNTDLLALGGAIVSAGILTPSSITYGGGGGGAAITAAASSGSDATLWVVALAMAASIGMFGWLGNNNNNKMDFNQDESSSLPPPIKSPEHELMSLWDQTLTRNTENSNSSSAPDPK
jgi:hypothetical protein